jgi:transposase-like protein
MPLNDLAIKRAKFLGPKITKLSDGGGLQIWITPDGAKRWRLAYRFGGKQRALAIGVYPAVSLKEAREARGAAKRMVMARVEHRQHKGLNNRAENSHVAVRKRERMMQGFRSWPGLQRFVSTFSAVRNHFVPPGLNARLSQPTFIA